VGVIKKVKDGRIQELNHHVPLGELVNPHLVEVIVQNLMP
jgi:hypothetical protein